MSSTSKKADEAPAAEAATEETSEAAQAFFQKAASEDDPVQTESLEDGVARYGRRPYGWRSATLILLVIAVSGWLLYSMRADLTYFLAEPEPVSLGDFDGYDLSKAEHNLFVEIEGLPHHLQAQYRQLGRRYVIYPLLGTRVFVRERLQERDDIEGRHPTFSGEGRLLDIREEGTYANVRAFFQNKGRYRFDEPAWLLLVDVRPRGVWWVPVAYALLLGVLVLNLVLLVRKKMSRRR